MESCFARHDAYEAGFAFQLEEIGMPPSGELEDLADKVAREQKSVATQEEASAEDDTIEGCEKGIKLLEVQPDSKGQVS